MQQSKPQMWTIQVKGIAETINNRTFSAARGNIQRTDARLFYVQLILNKYNIWWNKVKFKNLSIYKNAFTSFKLDILSFNFRPLVSKGKSRTQIPEATITISNNKMAAIWWHPRNRLTATRGHIIPPTLPTELATPTPVVLTDVGYTCRQRQLWWNFKR